jgi:putative sigma-54 modulation protein
MEHVAEVRLSSGSEHHEASEASADMYASIDKVIDKLERQISSSKGHAQARRRAGEELRTSPETVEVPDPE